MKLPVAAIMAVLLLSACKEQMAEAPAPQPLTEEALSFFCQMNVLEHGGPKAQIHLEGQPAPLFFAQVRDGVAYLKSPERDARVTAVYVSDMGAAASWDAPGETNWVAAGKAAFVIGAGVAGGMGAPEVVPSPKWRPPRLSCVATAGGSLLWKKSRTTRCLGRSIRAPAWRFLNDTLADTAPLSVHLGCRLDHGWRERPECLGANRQMAWNGAWRGGVDPTCGHCAGGRAAHLP